MTTIRLLFARTTTVPAFSRLLLVTALLGLAGCASTPERPSLPAGEASRVVNYAMTLQGAPYRPGKESPREGFDCSGFVQHVYGRHGISLPRTAREMANRLPAVDKSKRQPGDLVFFNTGSPFSHVGIYVGSNRFIHAPSQHTGHVLVSDMAGPYWWPRFTAVRRPGLLDRWLSGRLGSP
jgi:cell wall-associated NlpC family hydrolase